MGDTTAVQFSELQASKRVAIAWGFLWRGLVATLCSAVAGAIAGGILGFVVGFSNSAFQLGASRESVMQLAQLLGGVAGIVVTLVAYWFYVAWLFSARIGGYRLRLAADPSKV